MAHTSKCQHHESQPTKCLPITDKVESWLYNNCYPNNIALHNLRSSTITTESPRHHDDDESSVDTTKYIKSNRTITRTKITSMSIKHYCYLSATVPSKSTPKIASERNSRRSVAQRFANIKSTNPNLVQPKRKRRVRYKTATSGKSALAVTAADSSSGDDATAPMIENRYSRRIAKRQKLQDSSQRN